MQQQQQQQQQQQHTWHDNKTLTHPPTAQTTPTETVRLAAASEAEQRDWVRVLASCSTVAPSSSSSSESSAGAADATPSAVAAVAEADAFWAACFGAAREVAWPQFVRAYQDAVHCDLAADGTGAAFYCIANIISQGRL